MHLFINALAASAGGGLTYIRNLLPQLAATPGLQVSVALAPGLREELREWANISYYSIDAPAGRRFWFEQRGLPGLIRQSGADVLLSAGNFALRKSPVPQILLSRNSIYTSGDYYKDLLSRQEYRAYLDTRVRAVLAKKSIRWADVTVAPSQAFAAELTRWTGRSVCAIHHGFDLNAFTRDSSPMSEQVQEKFRNSEGSFRLLFVSHYNYYRNFETLIRALPRLRARFNGRVRLLLTCKLAAGENPGSYNPESAGRLVKELGAEDMVIELGAIPYGKLHQLYRRADVYVTPAYTETFAHPLVEAMACGLPVVASELGVHREICEGAAIYFPRFSADELADRILQVSSSPELTKRMAVAGLERSIRFSWKNHADALLKLASALVESKGRGMLDVTEFSRHMNVA